MSASIDREAFRDRVLRSQECVFLVARWLNQRGNTVIIPAISLVPDGENPLDYVDNGDLWYHKPGKPEKRMEVRGLSTQFTCRDDWPHRKFKICNTAAFVRHDEAPAFFVMVNRDRTHVAVLDAGKTFLDWDIAMQSKSIGKGREEVFVCNPDLASFFALPPLQP